MPDPLPCLVYLFAAFLLAGIAQTLWLRSTLSKRLAWPLDARWTWRGRRLLGDNKTLRGLVVMIPAVGLAFAGLALWPGSPWHLGPGNSLLLGGAVGLGFMLGELPNSFLKRQLDIEPGAVPGSAFWRGLGFLIDQADSLMGGLVVLALLVPVPWQVWVAVLLLGTLVHWAFNGVLMLLGVKTRAG